MAVYSKDNKKINLDADAAKYIIKLLQQQMRFCTHGRRNDDAVDWCICWYVLDKDADPLDELVKSGIVEDSDIAKMANHIDRVSKYLVRWDAAGDIEDYLVRDYHYFGKEN